MRIIKLFKNHVLALIVAVGLITISCNADLTLPTYMSEIVDVGIQQGGIASSVPDTIRATSLADLEMFMTEEDEQTVEAAYAPEDADGVRTYQGSEDERADDGAVANAMSLPETVALALEQGVDASTLNESMTGTLDMDTVRAAVAAGIVPRDQLVSAASAMSDQMGAMGGSIVKQRAINYVSQEYEAQGISLSDVQNSYLASMSLKMFALCAVSLVATILTGAVASHTACTIARDLRRKTFDQVMHFSPAEVGKFSQASLITRCTNDIQQIQMATTLFIRMVLMAPIMGVVAIMRVLATHTGLEWTIGIAVIAVSAVVGVLMGLTMPKFKKMQMYVDRVNLVAREMLDGVMPIRAFGRQSHELERFDGASRDLMDTQLFTNRAMSFMMPLMMFVMNCVTVLIVWAGSHGVSDGVMQVGDMMAFISYTMQIVMAFMILTMVSVMLPRAEVAAERVEDVLSTQSSIREPAHPKLPTASAPRGELAFHNVSFQYPDAREDVIGGVDFTVHAGETLGIIGSTGSGKSTLVQLIPRLYDTGVGSVSVMGADVRAWPLDQLRHVVATVPQRASLVSGTIRSNLTWRDESATDEELWAALEMAQASEFVRNKPQGLDAPVEAGGKNFSGGQRQRLTIARALVGSPQILIMDDSASALDFKTDAALRHAIRERSVRGAAAGGLPLMTVIVSQRVSTVRDADMICVLDHGSVAGLGTHDELYASCQLYREICQSQLRREELEGQQGSTAPASAPGAPAAPASVCAKEGC